jgi:2-polyprenyl-3-methyl-5-hydroxy-6-metoxy-1,4-benzoquinol methylase
MMESQMNKLQRRIYNEGERLVPYISHDESELIRHRSSYAFFHQVINADLQLNPMREMNTTTVVDLGFGCGYGCTILSGLPNVKVTGVDIGPECKIFAEQYYYRHNVEYIIDDLVHFIPNMEAYDYAVSRGVLEHVPDGLKVIQHIKAKCRVMIDVPYDELPGNEHHVLTGICEDAFAHLQNYEIFYEDLEGNIYTAAQKPPKANMIMVVISDPSLPKISSMFTFPIAAVKDAKLETLSTIGKKYYYDERIELLQAIEKAVKETDVVLDIGCGIRPMNYFRPKLHLLVEPFKEYIDILTYRHAGEKNVVIIKQGALEALNSLADNSVDSIFLLDVIEHLEKKEGKKVIQQCERVAREQVVIFTPLGFMPQHVEKDGIDAWGLSGGAFQQHLSGWTPEDFEKTWIFHICDSFHGHDSDGKQFNVPFGAFFAILNCNKKLIAKPSQIDDLRIPFFSAYDAEKYHFENNLLKEQMFKDEERQKKERIESELRLEKAREEREMLYMESAKVWQSAFYGLLNSRSVRLIRFMKSLVTSLGFKRVAQIHE